MSARALAFAALAMFVVGVVLMVPFEAVAARIAGVAALFAYLVLGVFAIASPSRLERVAVDDEADGEVSRRE